MSVSPSELTIFYAWQSDSPGDTNRNAIRLALARAAAEIESAQPGLVLKIDEATRDMIGSDNVPDSIRAKIEAADVFLGDVTTVTPPGATARACPNPNVTFEIGYAAAHLGWKRLILLTNLSLAKFEDLPFDFDRQRVSRYSVKSVSDKTGITKLQALLGTAITAIIKDRPPRPAELKIADPREIRRRRDIENATWALSQIKMPVLQQHIEELPHRIANEVLHFFYSYHGVIKNSLFHINDPELDDAFRGLDAAWQRALEPVENYHSDNVGCYIFGSVADVPLSADRQRDWDDIVEARKDMVAQLAKLLDIIRRDYVEIDLKDTNRRAHDDWRREKADAEARLWTANAD